MWKITSHLMSFTILTLGKNQLHKQNKKYPVKRLYHIYTSNARCYNSLDPGLNPIEISYIVT